MMSSGRNGLNCSKSGMSIPEIIRRKRTGKNLKEDEIQFFVKAVVEHTIQEAQLGAMLMAMAIRNLNDEETTYLTRAMTRSGDVLQWPNEWKGSVLDKHSTGGVGDKVSLVLAPILAACGFKVPMVSGRGLAHTGGTLDKLESIPGFNVNFTHAQMLEVLEKVGCCIVGQTSNLVPADKIMYATRDVTATTDNIGLITSSIISKKVAESLDALVLDVKCGSGAFLANEKDARELASRMVKAGNGSGVKTVALLTDMSSPLGNMIGNALEVVESIYCLHGNGPADLMNLIIDLGAHLLLKYDKVSTIEDGHKKLNGTILDGSAMAKFNAMMKAQGVKPEVADKLCAKDTDLFEILDKAKFKTEIKAKDSGYIHGIDALKCALACSKLGAGRSKVGEQINFAVGLELRAKVGETIEAGSTWIIIHHDTESVADHITALLERALVIKPENTVTTPNVNRVIDVIKT